MPFSALNSQRSMPLKYDCIAWVSEDLQLPKLQYSLLLIEYLGPCHHHRLVSNEMHILTNDHLVSTLGNHTEALALIDRSLELCYRSEIARWSRSKPYADQGHIHQFYIFRLDTNPCSDHNYKSREVRLKHLDPSMNERFAKSYRFQTKRQYKLRIRICKHINI